MTEVVYLNGSLIPRSKARVSVFDYGYLYGYGLFETMRAYHGKIFLLERHLKRLLSAAEVIGLGAGLKEIDLGRTCLDTLQANHLEEARLRLTVSPGDLGAFPGAANTSNPTVLVTATAYKPLPAGIYAQGYRAGVASLRRCRKYLTSGLKTTNYLINILARREAGAAGLDEALLLNEAGFITEGSVSNIFFVKDSGLVTPSLKNGILPGVTRAAVIELAHRAGVSVSEADIELADLNQFDEAFLTNSVIEIMPLVAVRDESAHIVSIGSGKPGDTTKKFMSAYSNLVAEETG